MNKHNSQANRDNLQSDFKIIKPEKDSHEFSEKRASTSEIETNFLRPEYSVHHRKMNMSFNPPFAPIQTTLPATHRHLSNKTEQTMLQTDPNLPGSRSSMATLPPQMIQLNTAGLPIPQPLQKNVQVPSSYHLGYHTNSLGRNMNYYIHHPQNHSHHQQHIHSLVNINFKPTPPTPRSFLQNSTPAPTFTPISPHTPNMMSHKNFTTNQYQHNYTTSRQYNSLSRPHPMIKEGTASLRRNTLRGSDMKEVDLPSSIKPLNRIVGFGG